MVLLFCLGVMTKFVKFLALAPKQKSLEGLAKVQQGMIMITDSIVFFTPSLRIKVKDKEKLNIPPKEWQILSAIYLMVSFTQCTGL